MNRKFISWSVGALALATAGAVSAQDWRPSAAAAEAVDTELWYYCVYITLDSTEYLTEVFPAKTSERGAISEAWKAYVSRNLPIDNMPHIACSSNEDRVLAEHYRSGRSNRKIPVSWPSAPPPPPPVEIAAEQADLNGSSEAADSGPATAAASASTSTANAASAAASSWAAPADVQAALSSSEPSAETQESIEQDVAAVLASREAEWQKMKAESDAQIAAREEERRRYEAEVAALKIAHEQWAREKAANDAAIEKARIEEERFQRELEEFERLHGKKSK